MRVLTAIPVYNEERHLVSVVHEVQRYSPEILVVNDGSTDRTAELLAGQKEVRVVTHPHNRGYGAALISAFTYALEQDYDVLVTTDCDGQHEPARIPVLLEAIHNADIVSGSRYLRSFRQDTPVPQDRLRINQQVTAELNKRTAGRPWRGCRSPRLAGACRSSSGCRGPGWACASRRSRCRASTSIPTGPSAACSTTPTSDWRTIGA